MRIVCAWCGKEIGKKENDDEEVSHGLCEECFAKLEAKKERETSNKTEPDEG